MPLVFAAIAPHGFPLIPDLGDDAGGAMTTRAAMEELGRRAATADVEALVIAGPHGYASMGPSLWLTIGPQCPSVTDFSV